MKTRRGVGIFGENLVCRFLEKYNFIILHKNFWTRFGEIDIIAYDVVNEQLVFLEVKTRFGRYVPEYAIDNRKKNCLLKAALKFFEQNDLEISNFRFDSVSVRIVKRFDYYKIYIRHIKNCLDL